MIMKKIMSYSIIICGLLSFVLFSGCEKDPDIIDEIEDIIEDESNDDKENEVDGNQITAYFTGQDLEIVFPDGSTFTILANENSNAEDGKIVISTDDDEGYFNTKNSMVYDFTKTNNEYTINFEHKLPKNLIDEDISLFFYAADSVAQKFEAHLIDFDYEGDSGEIKAQFNVPSDNPTRGGSSKYSKLVLSFCSRTQLAEKPKEHIVKMPFYEQPGGSCWATCATMMGRAYTASADRKREIKVIDFLKYMEHSTLDEGLGLYSFKSWLPHAIEIYSKTSFETSTFVSSSNMLSEIIDKLSENKPLIMNLTYPNLGRHAILIIGYKIELISAAKVTLQLLYHNPADGMYKWADYDWLMKDKWPQEAFQILYAQEAVPSDRALSTLGMPLKHQDGKLAFIVPMKNAQGKDVEFDIDMVYDLKAEYKYYWEFSYGNKKIDAVPDTASVMRLKLPVYNASQQSKQLSMNYRAYERESGKRLFEESEIETYEAGKSYYKTEIPINKFYFSSDDKEDAKKNVKVRMELELWEGGTYHDGYTIYFEVEQKEMGIALTTSKKIGEQINLMIDTEEYYRKDVWIDLNNNGKKEIGEEVANFDDYVDYTLGSQTITINGNVRLLGAGENKITSLDLSNGTALKFLLCHDNLLTTLDASSCIEMTILNCSDNPLTSLNVNNCVALTELLSTDTELTKLDVSNCKSLETLYCWNNKLTTLDVSVCEMLDDLRCADNKLTSLNVSGCKVLTHIDCDVNQLGVLDVSAFTLLETLSCSDNKIKKLDVNGLKLLKYLYCHSNNLDNINITGCEALETLNCGDNNLTFLNVKDSKKLKQLIANDNKISTLDVNNLKELEDIRCNKNQLTSLNVNGCSKLKSLNCEDNFLAELNVSGLKLLKYLQMRNNQLAEINASDCAALEKLSYNNGALVILNVSGCSALTELYCFENRINTIDVSGCTALINLSCRDNQLTSLDVSNFTKLEDLYCQNNQLTSLNVDGCSALYELNCENNGLLGVVPDIFEKIYSLYYDVRYKYEDYYDEEEGKIKYRMIEDTEKGWWYRHEPEGGCHNPDPCN